MRERFKRCRICSSENYELSRKVSTAKVIKQARPCLMCFGKKIYIPKDKVASFGDMVKWD